MSKQKGTRKNLNVLFVLLLPLLALLAATCTPKSPDQTRDQSSDVEKGPPPILRPAGTGTSRNVIPASNQNGGQLTGTFTNNKTVSLRIHKRFKPGDRVVLWVTKDGGRNWSRVRKVKRPKDRNTIKFNSEGDGTYGFVQRAPDDPAPGRSTIPEQEVTVDTSSPSVSLLYPNGGELLPARQKEIIRWTAKDAHLQKKPIKLQLSQDGGKTWSILTEETENNGVFSWTPDFTSSDCKIRITVKDRAGNSVSTTSRESFSVDGKPPTVRITGPPRSSETNFEVSYKAKDHGDAGIRTIEMYFSPDDGETWHLYGKDLDRTSPFQMTSSDGMVGLYLASEDRLGNATRTPESGTDPMHTITIDTRPPELQLLKPSSEQILTGGKTVNVEWNYSDPHPLKNGVEVQIRQSPDGTWNTKGTLDSSREKWALPVPKKHLEQMQIRLKGSDAFENRTRTKARNVRVDYRSPNGYVTNVEKQDDGTYLVHYKTKNQGFAPIDRTQLHVTHDGGKTWSSLSPETGNPKSPKTLKLDRNPDRFGCSITVSSKPARERDAAQKPPSEGDRPQYVYEHEGKQSSFQFQSPRPGQVVKAGSPLTIRWETEQKEGLRENLDLEVSRNNGAWGKISRGMEPGTNSVKWTVPDKHGEQIQFRLTSQNDSNQSPLGLLDEPITVDGRKPRISMIAQGDQANHPVSQPVYTDEEVSLDVEVSDRGKAGVDFVELWTRETSENKWKKVAQKTVPDGEKRISFSADLNDGTYDLYARAGDHAGNNMATPDPSTDIRQSIVVDTQKPEVRIVHPKTSPTVREGESIRIKWIVNDRHAGETPVTVRFSPDGQSNWTVLESSGGPEGSCELDTTGRPETDQGTVELTAVDRVGHSNTVTLENRITIDHSPPAFKISNIEEKNSTVYITADGGERGPAGLKKLQVHYRTSGDPYWHLLKTTDGNSGRIPVSLSRGKYEFQLTGVDNAGNSERRTNDGTTFTVSSSGKENQEPQENEEDSTKSKIFASKNLYRGGSTVKASWKLSPSNFQEDSVRIEYQPPNGTWTPLDTNLPLNVSKPRKTKLPEITAKGVSLRISARDESGKRVTVGETVSIDLDTNPPLRELNEVRRRSQNAQKIQINYRINDVGPAGVEDGVLWYRTPGSKTWKKMGHIDSDRQSMVSTLPKKGTVELFLTGVDRAGNRNSAPDEESRPMATLGKPGSSTNETEFRISLSTFSGGNVYRGGEQQLYIAYSTRGGSIQENSVSYYYSTNGGNSWNLIASGQPDSGRYLWSIPEITTGSAKVKVEVKDKKGNTHTAVSADTFTIDSSQPAAYPKGPKTASSLPVEINYVRKGGPEKVDISSVRLWYRKANNRTWTKGPKITFGEKLSFQPHNEGRYLIHLTAQNKYGWETKKPEPGDMGQMEILVDTTPPNVELDVLSRSNDKKNAKRTSQNSLNVRWKVYDQNPEIGSVTARWESDALENGSKKIASGLPLEGTREFKLPNEASKSATKLVIEATDRTGNRGNAAAGPFRIDNTTPSWTLNGPELSKTPDVNLTADIDTKGQNDLKWIELWTSENGGQTWEKQYRIQEQRNDKLQFDAEQDGEYGFYLVISDLSRNKTRKPTPGTKPAATTLVDTTQPELQVDVPDYENKIYRGGEHIPVKWNLTEENPAGKPISLSWRMGSDGSWNQIAKSTSPKGKHNWKLPKVTNNSVWLRVTGEDRTGRIDLKEIGPLVIDSTPPRVMAIKGPDRTFQRKFSLKVNVADQGAAGLHQWNLFITRDNGKTWRFFDSYKSSSKTITIRRPHGKYGFAVQGEDHAGNVGPKPSSSEHIQKTVFVDFSKPDISLNVPGDLILGGGNQYTIKWETGSDKIRPGSVKLMYSRNGGQTWETISSGMDDTGRYNWNVPKITTLRAKLKIEATGKNGVTGTDVTETNFVITSEEPVVKPSGARELKPDKDGADRNRDQNKETDRKTGKTDSTHEEKAPENVETAEKEQQEPETYSWEQDVFQYPEFKEPQLTPNGEKHKNSERYKELINQVLMLLKQEKYQKALSKLEQVRELIPEEPQHELLSGYTKMKQNGDPSSYLPHFRQAVEKAPENGGFQFWLGVGLLEAGNHQQASSIFRTVQKTDGRAESLLLHGISLYQKGDYSEAAKKISSFLKLHSASARGQYYAGMSYFNIGNWNAAARHYKNYLDLGEDPERLSNIETRLKLINRATETR